MNSREYRFMREEAKRVGCSVPELIRREQDKERQGARVRLWFMPIDTCLDRYQAYKHATYTAFYNAKDAAAPHIMCIDIETTPDGECFAAMCLDGNNALHYVGCSKGSMSSAQPNLQSIPKAQPVNKTSAELQVEFDIAKAQEAAQATADARREKLAAYRELAAATDTLLRLIQQPTTSPSTALAKFRFELKALAAEFSYRIVLIGDRSMAVLVQQ